ncbi:MAG: HXXEE domain-containing protein [Bacteroidales bacterium]|nr:HXXEE domain-containing protein [Bacteroidales bacterium]
MKHYALEIYTVIALLLIVLVAMFMDGLTVIQQFAVFMSFLFVLHEWEEGRYPGGFLDLISANILQTEISLETQKASRLITAVFIYVMTVVPFFFGDRVPLFALTMATFCIFEGIIHIVGIKLLRTGKPYTPGMVTAEIELVTGVTLVVYIAVNHLAAWYDYTFAPFLFIACFALMQRSLMAMIGFHYSDIIRNVKQRLG